MIRTISHDDMGLLDALLEATCHKCDYVVKAKDKWLSGEQFDCGERGHVQLYAVITPTDAIQKAFELRCDKNYSYVSWQWAGGPADAKAFAKKMDGYTWTLRFEKEEE